jgi:hypothetical protein
MIRFPERGCSALVLLVLLASPLAWAGEPSVSSDPGGRSDRDLARLGEHFYAAGEYYRAVGTFAELRFFSSDDQLKRHAALRIAMAYHHGLRVDEAVRAYDALLVDPGLGSERAGYVRLLRVLARAEGSWRGVRPVAPRELVADLEPLERAEGAPYRISSGVQIARFWLAAGERAAAAAAIERTTTRCHDRPDQDCASLARLRAALALPPPRHRSPWIGGLLSAAVPGLGSLYDGSPFDAVYHFGLTVGPGLMAWDVHDRARSAGHQAASFYVLTSLAALFYVSSITQGALGAARFNDVEAFEHRRAVLRTTETPLPLERAGFLAPL